LLPFEFIVDGVPVSQQTRRQARLHAWKATVRQEAEKYWPADDAPTSDLVMVKVTYFYDSVSMDVDNIVKPIQDALVGLIYVDDDQVTDVVSRKRNLSGDFRVEALSSVLAAGLLVETSSYTSLLRKHLIRRRLGSVDSSA
jgi:Holliday junction resolvase RusA-like endonuclease